MVVMYLFDTDTVISLMKEEGSGPLSDRIGAVPFHQQFLSSITLSELIYGAQYSDRPDYHLKMISDVLLKNVQLVSFDAPAAYQAGSLRATLRRKGNSIDFADLQIAAISLSRGLILVTGNQRHFARIPNLVIENWIN
jgi:tRNA(fMet)-specific endonuclease VapC